jgi:hypothetical protein
VELLDKRDAGSHVHHSFTSQLVIRQSCGCDFPTDRLERPVAAV